MKIAIKTVFATDYFGAMPYTEALGARNAVYGQPVNHRNLISWGSTAEEIYNTGIVCRYRNIITTIKTVQQPI